MRNKRKNTAAGLPYVKRKRTPPSPLLAPIKIYSLIKKIIEKEIFCGFRKHFLFTHVLSPAMGDCRLDCICMSVQNSAIFVFLHMCLQDLFNWLMYSSQKPSPWVETVDLLGY